MTQKISTYNSVTYLSDSIPHCLAVQNVLNFKVLPKALYWHCTLFGQHHGLYTVDFEIAVQVIVVVVVVVVVVVLVYKYARFSI